VTGRQGETPLFPAAICYTFLVEKADESRCFDTLIGVDLGGGKGKNTAVARLEREDGGVRVEFVGVRDPAQRPFYDGPLIDYLLEYRRGALLAIDAPLSPSVCVRCRLTSCESLAACPDPVVQWFRETGDRLISGNGRRARKPPTTAYTQRACEVVMHALYGILPRETLGQGMGPLTARAHYLRRALAGEYELNRNLIEVYPKATVHALFGATAARQYKREVRTWQVRARILEALGTQLRFNVWREWALRNDHCFDAVIAAYTAYLWAEQGWCLPDEDRAVFERDGWIWFPPMEPLRR
jgi:predicted nuclease with RNAse H fold